MNNRNKRKWSPTVCSQFHELACQAVDEWDGQDNGDLFISLSQKLGIDPEQMDELADRVRKAWEEEIGK